MDFSTLKLQGMGAPVAAPTGSLTIPKLATTTTPAISGLNLNSPSGTTVKSGLANATTGKNIYVTTPATSSPTAIQSTTTLTSDKTEDIASNVNKLNTYANKGLKTDTGTGATTYADGSVAVASGYNDIRDANGLLVNPVGAKFDRNTGQLIGGATTTTTTKAGEPSVTKTTGPNYEDQVLADTSDEEATTNKILEGLKSSLDSSTLGMVDAIQKQFAIRKQEQADINLRQNKGMKNALLMGGVTGQGSSAQYAPISSEGIIGAQETYGIKQLAELDAQEALLIAEAKAAQEAGNFKIMEKMLESIETKRQEKIAVAKELNQGIAERNNALREENKMVTRDTAIADAYSGGATDVPSIMAKLKASGVSATIADVAETLKNIVPQGLDDLVKTLRTNGAPSDVLQKVLSSGNINDAYKNAGSWAAGGTGIIGEYNLYKAQAEDKGQVPVDFNSYQDMDANRKAKASGSGGGGGGSSDAESPLYEGLKGATATAVRSKVTKFGSEPQITNFSTIQDGYNFASSISDTTKNPADDQALIYSLAKALDPGSVVREGEYQTAQKYAQSWVKAYGKGVTQALYGTGFLSEEARSNIKKTIEQKYNSTKKTYDNLFNQYSESINRLTGRSDGKAFLIDYANAGSSTGDDLVNQEEEAKTSIIEYGKNNPDVREEITTLLTQDDPELGRPLTYAELLQIYQP